MTPTFRTYFRLHCPLDVPAVNDLRELYVRLDKKKSSEIFVRACEKPESTSFSAAYISVDFATESNGYSIDDFERKTTLLFNFLAENEFAIHKARKLAGIEANYFINFNSHDDEHRPVLNLTIQQVQLLARLDCALEFTGYFLF